MLQNDHLRLPPFHFDADPDPTFHSDADPDPDPTFSLMRSVSYYSLFPDLDPRMLQNDHRRLPPFHFDADPDPASQNDHCLQDREKHSREEQIKVYVSSCNNRSV
jgi:hypothetical protein